jgi:hypothetical protein
MASKSADTAGYEMTVTIELTEVNAYGDHLGDGGLVFTKKLSAKSLSGLGGLLADIEKLGSTKPPAFS